MIQDMSNWGAKFEDNRSKVKVADGNENVKIVFRAYLHQTWIDLRQTKTKVINGSFYIVEYILPAKILRFVTICNL